MNSAYAMFVKSRAKKMGSDISDIMHATIGLSGEAGEAIDVAKKSWVHCKPLDEAHLKEELGDALFYIQHACNLLGCTFADLIASNIAKLEKRYPAGYSDQAAQERADKQTSNICIEQEKYLNVKKEMP